MTARPVDLSLIRADQRAQPRDHLNTEMTESYAEDMANGAEFPPLVVFFDGSVYWLADGFHRHYAALGCGLADFPCEVHEGGLREAILYSCGANAAHGYRRSNADKRRAVLRMLEDEEWRGWSDREIARQCRVSPDLANRIRKEIEPVTVRKDSEPERRTYPTKHGTTSTMDTSRIGKSRATQNPAWSPADIPEPARQTLENDNANGWISTLIWDVEEAVAKLPQPRAAARIFPTHHRHTMSSEQARSIASWFSDFADAWADLHEEAEHVAAE